MTSREPIDIWTEVAWTTASGKVAAPGIGAVIADTGAMPAGDYNIEISLACQDTNAVGKGMVVEHRNAANGATLQNLGGCACPDSSNFTRLKYTLLLNERIRVIAGTAAGAAASSYIACIRTRTT